MRDNQTYLLLLGFARFGRALLAHLLLCVSGELVGRFYLNKDARLHAARQGRLHDMFLDLGLWKRTCLRMNQGGLETSQHW